MIVVAGNVGIEAGQSEPLEQVGLPQVADVVEDAARLVPARHRPQIAGENQQAKQAADGFQGIHLVRPAPRPGKP